MIGRTLAHYRILWRSLTLGGMAEVYRARQRIDRDAAIEVLPAW